MRWVVRRGRVRGQGLYISKHPHEMWTSRQSDAEEYESREWIVDKIQRGAITGGRPVGIRGPSWAVKRLRAMDEGDLARFTSDLRYAAARELPDAVAILAVLREVRNGKAS